MLHFIVLMLDVNPRSRWEQKDKAMINGGNKKNIKKHPENKINGSKKKPTDCDAGKKKRKENRSKDEESG